MEDTQECEYQVPRIINGHSGGWLHTPMTHRAELRIWIFPTERGKSYQGFSATMVSHPTPTPCRWSTLKQQIVQSVEFSLSLSLSPYKLSQSSFSILYMSNKGDKGYTILREIVSEIEVEQLFPGDEYKD